MWRRAWALADPPTAWCCMAELATIFRRLGVRDDADEAAIEDAWDTFVGRSGFDYGLIPQEIKDAYRFLKVSENRVLYRELLSACASEDPLAVPADKVHALRLVCQLTGLRVIDDPEREHVYHLRRNDQPNPWWTNLPPRTPPPPRPTSSDYVREYLRRVMLLQVFRNATMPHCIVFAVAYVVVLGGIGLGVRALYGWGSERVHHLMESREEHAAHLKVEREQPIRADHASAVSGLDELGSLGAHVASEFQQITGVEWSLARDRTTARTRELDLALIQNPSVREAWDALLASLESCTESAARRAAVDEIKIRIDNGSFADSDAKRLRQITDWSLSHAKSLHTQSTNLEHLRVMLAAERFEQHFATRERSEP